MESDLSSVDSGLRFGERAVDVPEDPDEWQFSVRAFPEELLAAAAGVDREAVFDVVSERTVAFETEEGGTLVCGRAAVRTRADYEAILDELVALLDRKYETVARRDDEVVVREVTFDPEKARTLGVSEGPAFGKLSSGVSVTVDGRTIPPEKVRTERTHVFPVE